MKKLNLNVLVSVAILLAFNFSAYARQNISISKPMVKPMVTSECAGKTDGFYCASKTKLVKCVAGKVQDSQVCNMSCNATSNACSSEAVPSGAAESSAH